MREPHRGDRVVHIYQTTHEGVLDTYVLGQSVVAQQAAQRHDEPPSAGIWAGMGTYYRINLEQYRAFPRPLTVRTFLAEYSDRIRDDLESNQPRFYPFTTHGDDIRTVQGIYLARATGTLEAILEQAMGLEEVESTDDESGHVAFAEARRLARERYFFARNPNLGRKAKERDGYRCVVCELYFPDRYPGIGEKFIEAHHVNPLSERPEREWSQELKTAPDDVVSLCSNCHRMVHRKRPALSVSELRAIYQKS